MLAKDLKSRHPLENRGQHVVDFFHACEVGKVETVRTMLANDFELYRLSNVGKPMCIRDNDGYTPIHWAAQYNNVDVIEELIKSNPDIIHEIDNRGMTVLHTAAAYNSCKVINHVLTRKGTKIKINAEDKFGYTPFHIAAINNQVDAMKCLIEQNADHNILSSMKDHSSELIVRIAKSGKKTTLQYLFDLDRSATMMIDQHGISLVAHGLENDEEVSLYLLEKTDLKALYYDYKQDFLLAFAIHRQYLRCVKFILDSGNFSVRCPKYGTVLHAAMFAHQDLIRELLSNEHVKNAVLNFSNDDNLTPLALAAKNGQKNNVKLLCQSSADVNKCSPLYFATNENHPKICQELLTHGADPNLRSSAGVSPYELAIDKFRLEIIFLFRKQKPLMSKKPSLIQKLSLFMAIIDFEKSIDANVTSAFKSLHARFVQTNHLDLFAEYAFTILSGRASWFDYSNISILRVLFYEFSDSLRFFTRHQELMNIFTQIERGTHLQELNVALNKTYQLDLAIRKLAEANNDIILAFNNSDEIKPIDELIRLIKLEREQTLSEYQFDSTTATLIVNTLLNFLAIQTGDSKSHENSQLSYINFVKNLPARYKTWQKYLDLIYKNSITKFENRLPVYESDNSSANSTLSLKSDSCATTMSTYDDIADPYLAKKSQEKAALNNRYLGLRYDAIEFDINDLEQYLSDWLDDIPNAANYIYKAADQNPELFIKKVDEVFGNYYKAKIYQLISDYNPTHPTIKLIAKAYLDDILINDHSPESLASLLTDLNDQSHMDDFLGDTKTLSTNALLLVDRGALAHVSDNNALTQFCMRYDTKIKYLLAKKIYEYVMLSQSSNLGAILSALNAMDNEKDLTEITFRYYSASIRHNCGDLAAIYTQNTQLFIKLFQTECELLTPDKYHNTVKSRELFYRKLVLVLLATKTPESAPTLKYINKLFARCKLNPITDPYKKSFGETLKGILPHRHDVSKASLENYSGPGSEL